jgi:hypothetical protein
MLRIARLERLRREVESAVWYADIAFKSGVAQLGCFALSTAQDSANYRRRRFLDEDQRGQGW